MPNDPLPSYGDPWAALFAKITEGAGVRLDAQSFFAEVLTYDASLSPINFATVLRYDSTVPEGPYRVATHISSLAPGDRVKIEDVTGEGGFVVSYHLPAAPTETPLPVIPVVPSPPPAGLVLAGSDTVERQTQSLVAVDLSTIAVNIAADVPIDIWVPYRKSAGAAVRVSLGLKLNATQILAPVTVSGATNVAESGMLIWHIGPREANYLGAAIFQYGTPNATGVSSAVVDMPATVLTSVVVQGLTANAAVTLFVKNIRVYTYPTT